MTIEQLHTDKEEGLKNGKSVMIAVSTAQNAAMSLFEIADAYRATNEPTLMQIATILYRGGHQIAHGIGIVTDGINNLRVDVEKAEKKERKETP